MPRSAILLLGLLLIYLMASGRLVFFLGLLTNQLPVALKGMARTTKKTTPASPTDTRKSNG